MNNVPSRRIVCGLSLPDECRADLETLGTVIAPTASEGSWSEERLVAEASGADAVVVTITNPVGEELLEAAEPSLQIVANVGVGFNNIDVEAATRRGVRVTNTPDVLTDATADLAFGLILSATRRIAEGDRLLRRGEAWNWAFDFMWGAGLQGATLGIVGLGRIGLAVARRARAFGMDIIAAGGRGDATVEQELGVERQTLEEVFQHSDVLSLHCPLNTDTHHLVNERRMRTMKRSAFLINTARGPIVDEAALVRALEQGEIAGAGLDVFEREPTLAERLTELDNVTLAPHLGSATRETRTEMARLAVKNVAAQLSGGALVTPVN